MYQGGLFLVILAPCIASIVNLIITHESCTMISDQGCSFLVYLQSTFISVITGLHPYTVEQEIFVTRKIRIP